VRLKIICKITITFNLICYPLIGGWYFEIWITRIINYWYSDISHTRNDYKFTMCKSHGHSMYSLSGSSQLIYHYSLIWFITFIMTKVFFFSINMGISPLQTKTIIILDICSSCSCYYGYHAKLSHSSYNINFIITNISEIPDAYLLYTVPTRKVYIKFLIIYAVPR